MTPRIEGVRASARRHWPASLARLSALPPEAVGVVVVAAVLRLYRLGSESLWLDEAFSVAHATNRSLWTLAVEDPLTAPHPPLHFVALKLWTDVFGASEASVRLLSALAGIGTVAAAYYLGRELFDRRAGGVGALLVAVSPVQVWYSQEARMYSLLVFLSVVSYYLLARLAREYTNPRAAAYVVVTALLGYTHVYGLFVVLAQSLYLTARSAAGGGRLSIRFRRWVGLQAGVGVLLSPWLVVLAWRTLAIERGAGTPISWIPEYGSDVFGRLFTYFVAGAHLDSTLQTPALVALAVPAFGCALALATLPRHLADRADGDAGDADDAGALGPIPRAWLADAPAVAMLALFAVTPILAPYVLSKTVTPILVSRYTIPASVGLYLLAGRGVAVLPVSPARAFLAVALVVGLAAPLPVYYAEDQKPQWREAASFVERQADADDVVVVSWPWLRRPFNYYFDDTAVEVETVRPSVSATDLRGIADGHEEVWLVVGYASSRERIRLVEATVRGPETPRVLAQRHYGDGTEVYRLRRATGERFVADNRSRAVRSPS